jgi:hypothetical protein
MIIHSIERVVWAIFITEFDEYKHVFQIVSLTEQPYTISSNGIYIGMKTNVI